MDVAAAAACSSV